MNVQLLLLLALVGPFCVFTRASPTVIPTQLTDVLTATEADAPLGTTTALKEELTVVTGPSPTEPAAAPEGVATDVSTVAAPPATTVVTEQSIVETETPAAAYSEAPEPLITDPPAVETAAPTEAAEAVDPPAGTASAEGKQLEDVILEDETGDGLSSGQVVGIVIGALLAVVIVIAVVIAVVRRMGKYSSAKNKKPAKKESVLVSPLRKKPAKQQERPKFWKF
ncbi:podoplanin isoform X1 [Dicentrarchus labrax]|uniref:podoplanin isoform X1 n=1 Tax=Dicentrarchus labrax TaxID=13489 RepID=UPI0021F50DEB|nr:podoplanin isoform X1 [Dicentrarchus labrax]